MAQDYEVLQFKKGDFQDDYGNYYCSMSLKGVGEPVTIAVKDPTQFKDGMTLYGVIESKTSRANKEYLKFKKMVKEESAPNEQPKSNWQPRDDMAIRAQWAIGQAVAWGRHEQDEHRLEIDANLLYAMVDRVKDSTTKQPIDEEFGDSEPVNLDEVPY